MRLNEKKEIILECYALTFDRMLAYEKVAATTEEIIKLENCPKFQTRMKLLLIAAKEDAATKLKGFMDSATEQVGFKATLEYCKLLYPDCFKGNEGESGIDKGNTEKENKRIRKEYGRIVGGENFFKSRL